MNYQHQYKVFEWLRFPLIIGVVLIHCFGKPFDYEAIDFYHVSGMDLYNLFRVSISKVLCHVCVPAFYFISGFLFYKGLEKWSWNKYFEKIIKRIKSLFIPFLIWNTIYIAILSLSRFRHYGMDGVLSFWSENGYLHMYWDSNIWNSDRVNLLGGADYASSPIHFPLWFLRDLMVVTVSSPIIVLLFRKFHCLGLLLLTVFYISGVFIPVNGFSAMAFLFFGAGIYFNMERIDITSMRKYVTYLLIGVSILLWVVVTLLNGHETIYGNVIYPFFVISGSFSVFIIASLFVKNNIFISPYMAKTSFFIYLSHTILIVEFCQLIVANITANEGPVVLILSYIAVPILVVFVCISIYYLLNKIAPKLLSVLIGYRK